MHTRIHIQLDSHCKNSDAKFFNSKIQIYIYWYEFIYECEIIVMISN